MSEVPYTVGPSIDDEAAWLAAHKGCTGSGDSYIVATRKPLFGRTVWDVYLEALGEREKADLSAVERVQLGKHLEGFVADQYVLETSRSVLRSGRLLTSRSHPRMVCTPDYWIVDDFQVDDVRAGVLECKTAGTLAAWEDGVPEHVWAQVQHQLAVTGLPMGSVAVLAGGPQGMAFRWADVQRDDAWINDTLIPNVEDFWRRVETREPYPVDGTDACAKALGSMWEPEKNKTVGMDGEWLDVDARLQEIGGQMKQLAYEETELKNRLREALKNAEVGVLPDGTRWSFKEQHRKEFVVKASTSRVLRRSEAR